MLFKIGSSKIRKNGNGKFFQNLMKTVANHFGKKIADLKKKQSSPSNLVSCESVFAYRRA